MGNSFTGIISSYERFTFQKGMEIFIFILRCLLVVVALQLNYGVFAIIVIDTVVNAMHTLFRIIFVHRVLAVKITFNRPDKTTLREIFSYSFFIALNVIVNQINWRVDTLIIGTLTNTKALSVFNIGSQLVFSFIAFASAISNIFTPKIVKMVALKTTVKLLTDEMIKIGRLQLFVLGYVLVVFVVFGRLFIQLFVGDEFELAYWVALIPMVPFMFVLAQTSTNAVLQALNKHKMRSLLLLFTAVLNIVFSIVLVKEIGMLGASIGTALTLFIGELILVNIYLIKVIKLDMLRFYKELIVSSLPVMVCTLAFAFYFSQYINQTWLGLILSCLATALVYLVFTYLLSLSKVEKNLLNKKLKKNQQTNKFI
jgi:O-antigen/teichoic acid export membrane protein